MDVSKIDHGTTCFFLAFCDDVVYAMRCMQHHFMEVGCVDKNGRPQVIAICQLQGHRQHGWQAHNRMGEYYRVSILVGNIIWRFPTMRVPQIIQSSWMTSPLGLKQAMVTTGDPPWLKKPPYDQGSSTIKGVLVDWCLLNSISLLHLFNYLGMTGHDYACQKELASWLWVEVISMGVVANSSIRLIFRLFF